MAAARKGLGLATGLLLLALCVLLSWRDPMMPSVSLDGSWMLAAEFAAKHGLVFGRDFIFTYGPYHEIATRLFDPATFPLVLFYDAFQVVAVFWASLRNRSLPALAAIAVAFVVLQTGNDSLSALALFGVFLACLQRGRVAPYVLVALCGPLVLAKLSFGLVALPLLLLADVERLATRRAPLLTITLLASSLAAYLAAGQPITALPAFVGNTLAIILGYGRAMQVPGDKRELITALLLAAGAMVLVTAWAWRAWRADRGDLRPAAAALGFAWLSFVLFKMGFVRQDPHTLIYHLAFPAGLAMAYGALDAPDAARRPGWMVFAAGFVVLLAASFGWRSHVLRPSPDGPLTLGGDAVEAVAGLPGRLATGVEWMLGRRFEPTRQARAEIEAQLTRTFPAVAGTVDAIPWDAGPLILSRLRYAPRPVAQSYSAYTPGLQRQDRDYLAGPHAPDTLILRVEDIDNRLPSLALGPSLPVIAQRYDAVGTDPLGIVLRRRATPRAMTIVQGPSREVAMEEWVATPQTPGRLVMARIKMKPSLAGQLAGLVYREPLVSIILHTAGGRDLSYRFVPDMARLGVAVAPLPAAWSQAPAVLADPSWSTLGEPITGFRLATYGKNWMFTGATVSLDEVVLAPGFGANLGALPPLVGNLVQSDATRRATFNGAEIFAHAPTTLAAQASAPLHLRGVAGLHPQPPGTPPGDGVEFILTATSPAGVSREVLHTRLPPNAAPVPFEVQLERGATMQLKTLPVGDTRYDWSYWGRLEAAP